MAKKLLLSASLLFAFLGNPVMANQDEFCAGFEEGFKTAKGDMVIVPICPIAPITPIGSTPYREGLKAGIAAGG